MIRVHQHGFIHKKSDPKSMEHVKKTSVSDAKNLILTNIISQTAMSAVLITIFLYFRNRLPWLYSPNTSMPNHPCHTNWLTTSWRIPDTDLLAMIGLDAFAFLITTRMLARLMLVLAILSIPLIVAFFVSNDPVGNWFMRVSALNPDSTIIANLMLLYSLAYVCIVFYFLVSFLKSFVKLRQAYLQEPAILTSVPSIKNLGFKIGSMEDAVSRINIATRSILVHRLPELADDGAFREYLATFGLEIEDGSLSKDFTKLDRLVFNMDRLIRNIESEINRICIKLNDGRNIDTEEYVEQANTKAANENDKNTTKILIKDVKIGESEKNNIFNKFVSKHCGDTSVDMYLHKLKNVVYEVEEEKKKIMKNKNNENIDNENSNDNINRIVGDNKGKGKGGEGKEGKGGDNKGKGGDNKDKGSDNKGDINKGGDNKGSDNKGNNNKETTDNPNDPNNSDKDKKITHRHAGIATLTTTRNANIAIQSLLCSDTLGADAIRAPAPHDVLWKSLCMSPLRIQFCHLLSISIYAAYVVLFMNGVLSIDVVLKMDYIEKKLGIKVGNEYLKNMFDGILVPCVYNQLLNLSPIVISVFLSIEGIPSYTELQFILMNRFFFFLFLNGFIGAVLSMTLFRYLFDVSANTTSFSQVLSDVSGSLVSGSVFFTNFVIQKMLADNLFILAKPVKLVARFFTKIFLGPRTRREKIESFFPESVQLATFYPTIFLVFPICMCYATIAPIMLFLGFLHFAISYFIFRIEFIFVSTSEFESGGVHVSGCVNQLIYSIIAMLIATTTHMVAKGHNKHIFFMVVIIGLSFYVKRSIGKVFTRALHDVPLKEELNEDEFFIAYKERRREWMGCWGEKRSDCDWIGVSEGGGGYVYSGPFLGGRRIYLPLGFFQKFRKI